MSFQYNYLLLLNMSTQSAQSIAMLFQYNYLLLLNSLPYAPANHDFLFQYNYLLLLNARISFSFSSATLFQYNYLLLLNVIISVLLDHANQFQYNYLLLLNPRGGVFSFLHIQISIQLLVTIKRPYTRRSQPGWTISIQLLVTIKQSAPEFCAREALAFQYNYLLLLNVIISVLLDHANQFQYNYLLLLNQERQKTRTDWINFNTTTCYY